MTIVITVVGVLAVGLLALLWGEVTSGQQRRMTGVDSDLRRAEDGDQPYSDTGSSAG